MDMIVIEAFCGLGGSGKSNKSAPGTYIDGYTASGYRWT